MAIGRFFPRIGNAGESIGSKVDMVSVRREIKDLIAYLLDVQRKNPEPMPKGLSRIQRKIFAQRSLEEFDPYGLRGLNIKDLTEADAVMWKNVNSLKEGRVLVSEDELRRYEKNAKESLNPSRVSFSRFIVKLYYELWS